MRLHAVVLFLFSGRDSRGESAVGRSVAAVPVGARPPPPAEVMSWLNTYAGGREGRTWKEGKRLEVKRERRTAAGRQRLPQTAGKVCHHTQT